MDTPHDTHGAGTRIVAGVDDSAAARAALEWAVRQAAAGLLELGRHTGIGGVGSVASHCLRHASCPVVLVPAPG